MTAEVDGSLYLKTVPGDFDPGRDAAAGPWCFSGVEDKHPGWMELKFIDPFDGANEVARAGEAVRCLAGSLLPDLTSELNSYHGTAHEPLFWRTILIYWIIETVQYSWSRYVQTEKLVQSLSSRRFRVEVFTEKQSWEFQDSQDFAESLAQNRDFQWWLDSRIIKLLAPSHWELIEAAPPTLTETVTPRCSTGIVRRIKRAVKHHLGFTNIHGTRLGTFWIALLLNLVTRPEQTRKPLEKMDFDPTRVFPQPFLELLNELLRLTMPRVFKEGFMALAAPLAMARYRPGRLRLGSLDWTNDYERFTFAFAQQKGERLVQFQHGGVYGVIKSQPMVSAIEHGSDAFATWGWTAQENYAGNFIPLPSPWLSKFANRHRNESKKLILVGTAIRNRYQRIESIPQPSQTVKYLEDKVVFLDALDKKPKSHATYRPYRRTYIDTDDGVFIEKQLPEIPLLGGNLERHLMGCRLLVLDHNSTSLNLALAANIPTVCYWDEKIWALCRQAQPYFDKLKQCGILYSDPVTAAHHVNSIWDDVPAWWNRTELQQTRREWVNRYALNNRFWYWEWIKTFLRIQQNSANSSHSIETIVNQ